MKKILCIGSVTVDIIVKPASTVPAPGTLRAVESVSTLVGGCATNCANDLAKLGVWAARLYFTTEKSREVDRVLGEYLEPQPFDPGACTRGLYLRGVE